MHSDAMPSTQLWLGQLIDSFNVLQSHNVAMVSPRTNNPGEGCSSLLKGSKDNPGEDVVLKEGHLPLYCALCPRAIFNRIGGFIKEYPFGWYETDELAYRMRKFGCFQGVSGASWIRHMGEATFIDLWRNNPQSKQVMESNHERCVEDMRRLGKI